VLLAPGLVIKAKTAPPASTSQQVTAPTPQTAVESGVRKFALPPSPPAIEGAPAPSSSGPGSPVLDMNVLPNFVTK